MTMRSSSDSDAGTRTPVLMLARTLDAGGIERDVSKFARHLRDCGIEPHVACFTPGGMRWREIEAAGIPLLTAPVKSFRSRSAIVGARILRRYIIEHNIRVVHAFDIPADIFGVPLARMMGVPVLSSQLCYRELMSMQSRLTMVAIDRVATGVFVNCEALATHLSSDWKLSRKHIHVCHNGYEPQEFHSLGRKRPAALAGASTVIGTVAVLRPEKNLGLLVEAFARVYRHDATVRLLIVGDGPMKPALVRQATELGVIDACVFQDGVPNPAEWMRAIDVFVLPSLSEGFSNSMLEAMACGCCPVASRVGGTPELVGSPESGKLFESNNLEQLVDALIDVTSHPDKREAMGEAAATFVHANFTIQQASARLASIYRELLGEPRNNSVASVAVADSQDSNSNSSPVSTIQARECAGIGLGCGDAR